MMTESNVKRLDESREISVNVTTLVATAPMPVSAAKRSMPLGSLAAAVLSGVLLWMCFFPLAQGWLAWVALVPLLILARSTERSWFIYLGAYAGGLVFFTPALQWMRVADERMAYAWIALSSYLALYFPASIFVLRRLDRCTPLPLVLTVPIVWTVQEFLRSFVMTGFAWYFLGHSQHGYLSLIQIADMTGAYGVSFLIAAVNAWLFVVLSGFPAAVQFLRMRSVEHENCRYLKIGQAIAVLGLMAGTIVYGLVRLGQDEYLPGPRVAVLQTNLDQRLRNQAARDAGSRGAISVQGDVLAQSAMNQSPPPHLVIWPETSLPWEFWELSQPHLKGSYIPPRVLDFCDVNQELSTGLARKYKTHHLFGINVNVIDEIKDHKPAEQPGFLGSLAHAPGPKAPRSWLYGRRFNEALLVDGQGGLRARYKKIHRVPFGEYVPLRDELPFLNNFAPYDFEYSITRGETFTRFPLENPLAALGANRKPTFHFGVLICFEDTDPVLARQYHLHDGDGPPVDFLVNMSNDGWFDGTCEHEEHLAISRFRAIECRRAIVRSVNMGVSAVIDGNGRVQQPELMVNTASIKNWVVVERDGRVQALPESKWADFKKVQGVLVATVPVDTRFSLYAHWGDWLPWGCVAILVAGFCWSCLPRQRMARIS